MAPIFASPDIAALIAAFPPPAPTKECPSLLRSRSGDTLHRSSDVRERFRGLLETSPTRIRLSDLPSRLGIDSADWLLSCYDGPLWYSRYDQTLIPEPETSRLRQHLLERLENAPIDIAAVSREEDVSSTTLGQLPEVCDRSFHRWQDTACSSWVYSDAFLQRIKDWMHSLTDDCWTEGIDMNQHYPDIPTKLLLELAKNVAAGISTAKGRWELLNDRAVFIPSRYEADLESKRQAARNNHITDLVDQLGSKGFCCIPTPADRTSRDDDVITDVKALYTQQATQTTESSTKLQEIATGDYSTMILARPGAVDPACETLRAAAPQEAARVWHARDGSESVATLKSAIFESLEQEVTSELARLILPVAHRMQLEDIVTTSLNKLEQADADSYSQAVQFRLLAPIQLYAAGIATVTDETLKQHLEEYVGEHFRREVVPATIAWLRESRLLLDRSRRRDMEKMATTCSDSKTLSDISYAVSRLARKHKVSLPLPEEVQNVMQISLQQKMKAIRKLSRGSDLLQNLLWIKFAEATGGLYMSSGKDTTRMIKHFQAVGDSDVGVKLERWRDELKGGKEGKEMLEEMRGMAVDTVQGMAAKP